MKRSERRAVLTLAALAVLGHGVRLVLVHPGEAPGAVAFLPPAEGDSLGAHREMVASLMRPLEAGERIDLDVASAQELTRLPRIGPGLAKRIVADRARRGPFGSLEALGRVSGIGPSGLEALGPFAAFSAPPGGPGSPRASPGRLVDVNRATAEELLSLPGIGPARAADLVAYREVHGPFATLESLTAVSGIGPGIVARLEGHAQAR
jgi:competence ComEA-like helix-hairpin-helix protein